MHAQNGGRVSAFCTATVTVAMADATDLQKELIQALLDSGISREVLLSTVDELCSRKHGSNAPRIAFGTVKDEVTRDEVVPLLSTPNIQENSDASSHVPGQSVVEQLLR